MKITFIVILCCSFLQASFCEEGQRITQLEQNIQALSTQLKDVVNTITHLASSIDELKADGNQGFMNDTLEERVEVLEFQVTSLLSDVTSIDQSVTQVEAGQIIQDQKLLELDVSTGSLDSSVLALQAADVGILDSIAALESEVQQIGQDTIAFSAYIDDYTEEPVLIAGQPVRFDTTSLNVGGGFNTDSFEFIVPVGGAGVYYLQTSMWTQGAERSVFTVFHQTDNRQLCVAEGDTSESGNQFDDLQTQCSVVIALNEGDVIIVKFEIGMTEYPLGAGGIFNIFNGFRIGPNV